MNDTVRISPIIEYFPPPTSFKENIKPENFTDEERDIMNYFLIDNYCQESLVQILRQKMTLSNRLYVIESFMEDHCSWVLEFLEFFWDYCKINKYVYDENGECVNIFKYSDSPYYKPFGKRLCTVCDKICTSEKIYKAKQLRKM